MTRYEYDEDASQRHRMDVLYEIDDRPTPVARWVDAMRRLNSIDDPLARRILALHRTADPVVARATAASRMSQSLAESTGVARPRP